MAGGSVRITVDTYGQLTAVAQRVLCWAAADKGKVQLDTGTPTPSVVIPEAVIGGKGALLLKRGGTDVVSGYVAGTNIVFAVQSIAPAIGQNVNTCPSSAAQPNGTVAFNVGGNPFAITLTVDNLAAGTVAVNWGDGTSTTAVAQNGTPGHTYPGPGERTITITDESDGTQVGTLVIKLPYGV